MTHATYALPVLLLAGFGFTVIAASVKFDPRQCRTQTPTCTGRTVPAEAERTPGTGGPPPLTHTTRDRPHTRDVVGG